MLLATRVRAGRTEYLVKCLACGYITGSTDRNPLHKCEGGKR